MQNPVHLDEREDVLGWLGGNRRIEVLWETFNLTNAVNYGGYVGNQRSPNFGKPSYATPPFQGQLGLRFDF